VCVSLVYLERWAAWLQEKEWITLSETGQAWVERIGTEIYFVSLPGWFVAAVLYVVLSKLYQQKVHPPSAGSTRET